MRTNSNIPQSLRKITALTALLGVGALSLGVPSQAANPPLAVVWKIIKIDDEGTPMPGVAFEIADHTPEGFPFEDDIYTMGSHQTLEKLVNHSDSRPKAFEDLGLEVTRQYYAISNLKRQLESASDAQEIADLELQIMQAEGRHEELTAKRESHRQEWEDYRDTPSGYEYGEHEVSALVGVGDLIYTNDDGQLLLWGSSTITLREVLPDGYLPMEDLVLEFDDEGERVGNAIATKIVSNLVNVDLPPSSTDLLPGEEPPLTAFFGAGRFVELEVVNHRDPSRVLSMTAPFFSNPPECDSLPELVLPMQQGVNFDQVWDGDAVRVSATVDEGYWFLDSSDTEWELTKPKPEKCDEPWTPLEPSTPGEENAGEESIPLVPLEPSRPAPTPKPTLTPTPEPTTDVTTGAGNDLVGDEDLPVTGFGGVATAIGASALLLAGAGATILARRKAGEVN